MKLVFRGEAMELAPRRPEAGRIVLEGRNHPDTLARVLGAMDAGAEVALLNTRLTEMERREQLAQLSVNSVHFPQEDVNSVHFAVGEVNDVHSAPRGPATLLFTSGTTGAPKAAVLSLDNHLASARAANQVLGVEASSRFVCALPLFHVGGLAIAFRCREAGATMILHERFDAHAVARDLVEGATHASLVATTLARLLEVQSHFPPAIALVGGGAVPRALLEKAGEAGLRVVQTWGMTETASMATCERPGDADGASAGPPLPGFEVKIDSGEILVRGPAVMRGYLGHGSIEGFFRTGDIGALDARGRLVIHARRADLIVSGGENVYPAEVEAALLAHPRVREAAVLPAPDERWGQVGVAYIAGAAAEGELRTFLETRLARYKIPARFIALEELPRNAAGKVDRLKLAASASPEAP